MKTKLKVISILVGALLAPVAAYATDSDKDRSSASAYVKDSVITTKIKARLAEEKLSNTIHIKVDTENTGYVQLGGTVKSQEVADKAAAIASGVEGVISVQNNIRVAGASGAASHAKGYGNDRGMASHANANSEERVEDRIKDMHAKLQITPGQEDKWSKVAQVMRDNAKQMNGLTKTRAEKADMNAIDDLKSYGEISEAHADAMRKFTPVFATLYDSMSDAQKKNADIAFRHGGRKVS